MTDITMPALMEGMEQGTIITWLVAEGAQVAVGDELLEIETDKATATHAAEHAGTLSIVAAEGSTVAVGEVIARIGAPTENGSAAPAERAPATESPPATEREPVAASARTPTLATGRPAPDGHAATPLARRIADAHGVVLAELTGTGTGGRIVKADVFKAAGLAPPPEEAPVAPAERPAPSAPLAPIPQGATLQPATRLQQTIARRMSEQALVPVFEVQTDVEMDAALAFRSQLKAAAGDGPAPSVNDLIVRACALALRDHPLVNGAYRPDGFVIHDHVSVGIAVASDAGLLVATIPHTDEKSLGQIAQEARALAERVRAGTASPQELSGGTFTVSNLGMFGMTEITAVINPPQAAILGVGAARPTLARDTDGEIVERRLVALNLTCDHRILNGADGSRFLMDVKAILERPLRLAL